MAALPLVFEEIEEGSHVEAIFPVPSDSTTVELPGVALTGRPTASAVPSVASQMSA